MVFLLEKKSTNETQSTPSLDTRLKEFHSFEPIFIRPSPPLLEPQPNEIVWLNPDIYSHMVLWDTTMCANTNRNSELRALMQKAFQEPLEQTEQQHN